MRSKFFMLDQLDQLAVQDAEGCERQPRVEPQHLRRSLLRSPLSLLPLLLRLHITMGIQVRHVFKPKATCDSNDHPAQADTAFPIPSAPSSATAALKTTVRRTRRGLQRGVQLLYPGRPCTSLCTQRHPKYLMTRVYRIFGLRHGTMMIAIHDLLWSSFVVFLLVLAAAHSREASCIVQGDMQKQVQQHVQENMQEHMKAHVQEHIPEHLQEHLQEHMQEHSLGLSDLGDPTKSSNRSSRYMQYVQYVQYVQMAYDRARSMVAQDSNEVRLHTGLHVATMMTMLMVFGISMAGIDMIASMMLLAGAMLNVRQLMMPWLSLRLIELVLLVGGSLTLVLLYAHAVRGVLLLEVVAAVLLVTCLIGYHWTAAYSLHEHLCRLERTGLVHNGLVYNGLVHNGSVHAGPEHAGQENTGLVHTTRPAACDCPCDRHRLKDEPSAPRRVADADSRPLWRPVYSYQGYQPPGGYHGVPAETDLLTGSTRNLSATTPPADSLLDQK